MVLHSHAGARLHRRAKSGFTLIELMIVVAIIGLLVAVLLAVLISARSKAKIGEAHNFLDTAIPTAISKWQDAKGKNSNSFPPSGANSDSDIFQGNQLLYEALVAEPGKAGKDAFVPNDAYSKGTQNNKPVFLDPWENPYRYRNWTQTTKGAKGSKALKHNDGTYDLVSSGPDGVFDNEDDVINGKK